MTNPTPPYGHSAETTPEAPRDQPKRPFRFATGYFFGNSRAEYLAQARKVEDLGYNTFVIPDHFNDVFAPLVALMAAVDATRALRVGSFVCANDFHHPVVLAKEAATLDLLSDGRFEFGIGTGYMQSDYAASGIPLNPPSVRVSRLEEAVQIIKGLFADGPVNFSGAYYTITDLEGYPKPAQRPGPPLFIGANGKRMLSIAAREADIIGLVPATAPGSVTFGAISAVETARQVEWVRQAAGPRFASLELNTLVFEVIVTNDRQGTAEALASQTGTTAEQLLDSIHFLIGTIDQMVETIQQWRERFGVTYISVFPDVMETFAPVVEQLRGK